MWLRGVCPHGAGVANEIVRCVEGKTQMRMDQTTGARVHKLRKMTGSAWWLWRHGRSGLRQHLQHLQLLFLDRRRADVPVGRHSHLAHPDLESTMSLLKPLATYATKGVNSLLIGVILPDTTSSVRWVQYDQPYLTDAFADAVSPLPSSTSRTPRAVTRPRSTTPRLTSTWAPSPLGLSLDGPTVWPSRRSRRLTTSP